MIFSLTLEQFEVAKLVQRQLLPVGNCYLCNDIAYKGMKQATYRVLLRKEPEGVYTAIVPSIPGCVTWGETIEEAIAMAREAAEGCLEVYAEKGIRIEDDSETFEYSINLPFSSPLTDQAA